MRKPRDRGAKQDGMCASCRMAKGTVLRLAGKGKTARRIHLCGYCDQMRTAGRRRAANSVTLTRGEENHG